MGYGLKCRGSIPSMVKRFLLRCVQVGCGTHPSSIQYVSGTLCSDVKRPGREPLRRNGCKIRCKPRTDLTDHLPCLSCFIPGERIPSAYCVRSCVGPTACLAAVEKREKILPILRIKLRLFGRPCHRIISIPNEMDVDSRIPYSYFTACLFHVLLRGLQLWYNLDNQLHEDSSWVAYSSGVSLF
jgi:hypothetical protein